MRVIVMSAKSVQQHIKIRFCFCWRISSLWVAVVKKDKKGPVIKALPHKEKPPMEKAVGKFVNHICRDDSFSLSGAISEINAPLDMR